MSNAKQSEKDAGGAARKVHIALGPASYDIHVGRGLITHMHDFVPFSLEGRNTYIVTDENVSAPHAASVHKSLQSCKPRCAEALVLPPGEQTKSFAMLERLTGWLLDQGVDRDSVLFAVGGGVVGDLTGFAAASIMRGINFVQVPTTLLAQVDSSVGGKTGINMPQGKNLVGAFYQPRSVICDIDTLATLPRREILAGYAETVKYGLINDPEFFIWLEKEGSQVCSLDNAAAVKAVETACRKKAEIVSADEKEKNVRALLNLGHTFGHALEAAAGYDGTLLHGEAVAIGMVLAFRLSARMGLCKEGEADRVEDHLKQTGLPTRIASIAKFDRKTSQDFIELMKSDKKAAGGKNVFILTRGIGGAFVCAEVSNDDVKHVLMHSMKGN